MQSFFVSSTFKDMQGERDMLHKYVMPRLREKAQQHGEALQFVDLRWGISTSELDSQAGAEKVLSVCLSEVRQCKPYMIVMLGERYGWIPAPELLEHTADEMGFRLNRFDMSVTELEVMYSLWLSKRNLDHFIFCLRDPIDAQDLPQEMRDIYLPASEEDKARMALLRRKIANTAGATIVRYKLDWDPENQTLTGYEAFGQQLAQALEENLAQQWGFRKRLTWQQRQREEDQLLIDMHQASFVGREKELKTVTDAIQHHTVVILEGEGGCGKSALMAKLLQKYQKADYQAHMFCCGNSAHCMSALQLMKLICWQLDFPGPEENTEDPLVWREYYQQKLADYEGPITLFFLDAIDQLAPDQALYESWFVPPKLSGKLRLVISTTGAVRVNPMALPTQERIKSSYIIKLRPPEEKDLRDILQARFMAEHKQVSTELAEKILANPCSKNMLGMEIIVRRLVMLGQRDFQQIAQLEKTMDGAAAINTYLLQVMEGLSHNLHQLINNYMDTIFSFLDKEHIGCMQLPIYFIALAQHGLSANQFEQLQHFILTDKSCSSIQEDHILRRFWDPILFSQLKRYLGGLLIQRTDGRVDFSHRLLREALSTRPGVNNIARVLMLWLHQEPFHDDSRLENILVLARRLEAYNREESADYKPDIDILELFFVGTIRETGNLEEDKDPAQAAEGKRQMDILKRSLLTDLTGPDSASAMAVYCDILDTLIKNGAMPNHFTIWFFTYQLVPLLEQLGDSGKAMAVQLLCRILASFYGRNVQIQAEKKSLEENWSVYSKKLFLLYHSKVLRLLGELRLSRAIGSIRIGNMYQLTAKQILETGLQFGDTYTRQHPEEPMLPMRQAMMCVYMAKEQLATSLSLTATKTTRFADNALQYARKALVCAKETGKSLKTISNFFLYVSTLVLECKISNHNMQAFSGKRNLRACLQLCAQTWEDYCKCGLPEEPAPDYLARFRNAWGDCLVFCAFHDKSNASALRQQAVDLRCDYYYSIRSDDTRTFSAADREALAFLGLHIGEQITQGYLPKCMEKAGFNKQTAAGFIAAKEGSYLQAQARTDFDSRWRWSRILLVEAYSHSLIRHAQCVETCQRAITLLENLHAEAKNYSYALDFNEAQIKTNRDYLAGMLERNREKLDKA